MSNYIALKPQQHKTFGWQPFSYYYHAAKEAVAPVTASELNQVITCMPMAFITAQTADKRLSYQLVSLHSLQPGHNLFVDQQAQWTGGYIPAHFRSYPFMLAQDPNNPNQHILCFDSESGLITEMAQSFDQPFFDESGQLAPKLNEIVQFLTSIEQDRKVTQLAVDALEQYNLIKPWPLELKLADKSIPVSGLFEIDEPKLFKLSADVIAEIQPKGALAIAYAQLLSKGQLKQLQKRYETYQGPATEKNFGLDEVLKFSH